VKNVPEKEEVEKFRERYMGIKLNILERRAG